MRYILFLLVFLPFFASAQPSEVAAKKIRATEKLQLDTAILTQIVRVISVASTHSQSPTAKAVYDFCQTLTGTTNLTFSGSSSPVTLNSSTGTDVTLTAGGGISFTATSTNTTITATDQSATNEPLTISVGANSETLAGQTLIVTGSGIITPTYTPATNTLNIAGTEVDGSTTNELQTLSVTGTTTGTVTLSNSGGSVNIAGAGTNTVSVSGNTITVTGTGDSKWTVGSGSAGIYNTALTNVSVGSTSVNLAKFRVVGNAAATGARFDAGTLEDFGAATQITALGADIFGINASLTASDEATYLFANQSETTGADATAVVQAVGGNPTTIYSIVGEGTSFIMGCDNAQSGNPFKIKPGSNIAVFGGLTMDANSNVGINQDAPTTELDVSGSKGISMPTGNIAARPTGKRTIRFNNDIGGFEMLGANGVWYRLSSTSTPSVSWNTGVIGTTAQGASVTLATGSNEVCGTIVITTGPTPTGTNVSAVSLSFPNAYSSGVLPFAQISQANAITATEWNKFYRSTINTTTFQIGVAAQLAANTTYRIDYRISQ